MMVSLKEREAQLAAELERTKERARELDQKLYNSARFSGNFFVLTVSGVVAARLTLEALGILLTLAATCQAIRYQVRKRL